MRFAFAAIAALTALTSSVAAADIEYKRCAAPDPTAEMIQDAADDEALADIERYVSTPITVQTYVHVVTTNSSANNFTQAQLTEQVRVMNFAYNPYNISFNLLAIDYTVNASWAASTAGSQAAFDMKKTLRRGSYADLNLYFLSDLGNGLLGYCYFPTSQAKSGSRQFTLDGCVNLAGSIPGGPIRNYNLGGTAIHEVGHWFGLFHVFQGSSCTGRGDYIGDTPIQKNATSGCPVFSIPDSCPGKPGYDNIHNYMDYSYDTCYELFTPKQEVRMHKQFNKYRLGH